MRNLGATFVDANGVTWSRESASAISREDGAVSIHRLTNGSVVLYRSGWGSTTTLPANVSAVVQALAPEWLAAASSQPAPTTQVKAAAETGLKAVDPNCKTCLGDGYVWDKKAREIPCACRKPAPSDALYSSVGQSYTDEEWLAAGKALPCNLPAGKDLDCTSTLPNEVKLVTASGAKYSVAEALDLLERCRVRRFPDEKPDPKVSEKILWCDPANPTSLSNRVQWWGCDSDELKPGDLWCYGPPVPVSG